MKVILLLLAVLPLSLAIPKSSKPAPACSISTKKGKPVRPSKTVVTSSARPTVIDQLCGSRGLPPCPDGYDCVAREGSTCGPETDCPGICVLPPASPPPCGTTVAPTPSPSKVSCGTLQGIQCPPELICISDPDSGGCGLACDEPGICVEPTFCGGFGGLPCPAGMECVDDWRDDCDPLNGGADCGGVCI
ncbi:hypothetical protein W97_09079 [Coniosporium apollinis CBS 100218]|uniref:IGFBP N-terminal domain-containing protein n=1 Tax=Coniosporium apollinis (strain CBS 100218) TaxID=1168221 RepID=R7Z7B0_CONA1|nr:uncharacterized protein W97_09079 [Coniosporium apollinis CBS 100218]EON69816.1 hypothetical protein W97_09079 [Coniosporium apollinis CBS 100218]